MEKISILLIFLFLWTLEASYDCTYQGEKYPCGTWTPDGKFVCNNLMLHSGNCLVVGCTQFNSCNCKVDKEWTCQMFEPNLTLFSNNTLSMESVEIYN